MKDLMKTQGIHLTWITVKDIKEAIKFYTETVGLELKEYAEEYNWAELSGPSGASLGIAQENPMDNVKPGTNAVVTVSVDNLEKAKAHFVQQGAKLVGDTMEIPGQVKLQTFMDADGNSLQLVEQLSK
jgi:predicted enzyme related to lactoylglutathione lyase